jgi:hypothetical protein
MRARLGLLAILVSTTATADSRTKQLAQGYEKELGACHTRSDGVAKVTTGTQSLVDAGQTQYQSDLDALKAGLDGVKAYCTELQATLDLITSDPNASYKSLEKQLDEHDNKIRKLRQSSKKVLDDLAPVIGKMIPAINARAGTAAPVTKKVPIKFPSGRTIDAPALAGTWTVSGNDAADTAQYTEGKSSATISVRQIGNVTCDQQRKAITAPSTVDVTPDDTTKPLGFAWYVAYQRDTRKVRVACIALKSRVLLATINDPTGPWPELEPVMALMIDARKL